MKINTGYKVMILLVLGLLVLMSCSQPGSDSGSVSDTLGQVWKRVLDNSADDGGTPTQFSKRSNFGAVVFEDKMWVIGGEDSNNYYNDVWSSEDGIIWNNVRKNNGSPGSDQFSQRSLFGLVALNNKLFVIGGRDSNNDTLNDVWSSSNGMEWEKITPKNETPGSDPFSKRAGLGSVIYKNRMWIAGGFGGNNIFYNDVWSSADGETWRVELANNNPPLEKQFSQSYLFGFTSYRNKLWIAGGFDGSSVDRNDVLSSEDGKNWNVEVPDSKIEQVENNSSSHFSQRTESALLAFGNTLFLVGGNNVNDVWTTSDGKSWTRILDSNNVDTNSTSRFGFRRGFRVLKYKNKLWFLGGDSTVSLSVGSFNDVWVSE